MEAFYFGENNQLFGIFHCANNDCNKDVGIVLCYPFGQEYIRTYKTFVKLSIQLANNGYNVFRFDYFGTGDSYGQLTNAGVSTWINNINEAITEIKNGCGSKRICLIGLRLGATLAALSLKKDINDIVYWHPVIEGKEYLKEIDKEHKEWLTGSFTKIKKRKDVKKEIIGFEISHNLFSEIKKISIHDLFNYTENNHLIICNDRSILKIKNYLRKSYNNTDFTKATNDGFWHKKNDDKEKTFIPNDDIDLIISWLNKLNP